MWVIELKLELKLKLLLLLLKEDKLGTCTTWIAADRFFYNNNNNNYYYTVGQTSCPSGLV
jgi:hypothetical protein